MKRISALLAALMLALTAACALAQRDPLSVEPTAIPEYGGYNPMEEEDNGYLADTVYDDWGNTVYAGATPIPLDPIDMPTPTPRPSLSFSYGAVTAENLGLAFEAPVGWLVDQSDVSAIVLTDPNMLDNINATIVIRIQSVSAGYGMNDVKSEVQRMLKEIGQYNYTSWTTTTLASRTLLKKDGYYANYRGEMDDKTVVRGRVMVALLDGNRIITLHASCPGWYNESYMNVVAHIRDTLTTR
ncbi:MAG: hypothetical protein MR400_05360 [Clostridiales bacterium]|nr:hypothetical protein [Clostridiales bacterium]